MLEARGRAPPAAPAGNRPARAPSRQRGVRRVPATPRAPDRAAAPGGRRGSARHHDGDRDRGAGPSAGGLSGWPVDCGMTVLRRDRAPDPGTGAAPVVAPGGPGLLLAFSLAAVGAGAGRALTTTYLPVLLERIDDAPSLIGAVMTVNALSGFAVPIAVGIWSDRRGRRLPFIAGGCTAHRGRSRGCRAGQRHDLPRARARRRLGLHRAERPDYRAPGDRGGGRGGPAAVPRPPAPRRSRAWSEPWWRWPSVGR